MILKWVISSFLLTFVAVNGSSSRPNIVFVMVDDMGWNDVSFHGSDQILTPNIDALAYQSVILQQYYTEPICTPARTALLTGKYSMRLGRVEHAPNNFLLLGMQASPLFNSEDRGIPLTERLLPSYLKDLGYSTHLVGKWHVGMSKNELLPTYRGYDTHYGMRGGFVDYYTYNKIEKWPDGRLMFGMDLFDDMLPQNQEQRYLVDALTDRAIDIIYNHNASKPLFLHVTHNAPHAGNAGGALQPPPYVTNKNKHIAHSNRRLYADVVSHLDASVGRLITALHKKNILHDTVIVFISDNGAPTDGMFRNWGVNLPFRGIKATPWEGGVRVPAFIWHSSFKPNVWNELMHITDWLPTLLGAAGASVLNAIDGVNQWDAIANGFISRRKEILVSVDDLVNFAALRVGDYKIIVGNMSQVRNNYYGQELMQVKYKPRNYYTEVFSSNVAGAMKGLGFEYSVNATESMRQSAIVQQADPITDPKLCVPTLNKGCLFNVRRDPMERHDIWNAANRITVLLMKRLSVLWNEQKHRGPLKLDIKADPSNTNYVWMPWLSVPNDFEYDFNEITKNSISYEQLLNSSLRRNDGSKYSNCGKQTPLQNFLCMLRNVF